MGAWGIAGCAVLLLATTACLDTTTTVYEENGNMPIQYFDHMPGEELGKSSLSRGSWGIGGDLFTQNPIKSVGLQATFPYPENYTIQFGVNGPPANVTYAVHAEVIWKVNGQPIRRVISVGNGVQITAPSEAVSVLVNDVTQLGLPNAGVKYSVNISVARGTRFGGVLTLENPPLPFSGGGGGGLTPIPGAGGTQAFPIPQNSGVVGVEVALTSTTAPPVPVVAVVDQLDPIGNVIKRYNPITLPGFIPVAPQASVILVTNLDPVVLNEIVAFATWQVDG
jgi:hypothetical protein